MVLHGLTVVSSSPTFRQVNDSALHLRVHAVQHFSLLILLRIASLSPVLSAEAPRRPEGRCTSEP